ncbi:MAG TPA: CocE/NonD family hydrolase [Actinomycetota bacterium]|nr:CocE/NonD family hydrolase [Actinomycetota bacterium]
MKKLLALLTGAMLLMSALSPASARRSSAPDGGRPVDYVKLKGLSQPKYETVREVFEVPMEDGINLYVEVERPKAEGRFPVILELSPYHGTVADRLGTRILPGPVVDGKHVGLSGYFAPRGYAVVFVDLRGTGRSEGCLDHLGPADASDSYEIVEWAAKQKWSNGRVGMTGHSYVGSTPQLAMAQKPPHLVTIVPSAGLARMYDHKFQNGVPYNLQWAGPLFAYEALAIDRYLPPGTSDPVTDGNTGDNFGNDPQYIGCGAPQSTAVTGDAYMRGQETQWDRDRDFAKGATKSDVPVFLVHGVNDNAARIAAADWFNKRRKPQDKAWIGQWDHGVGRYPNSRTCPAASQAPCENDQWTEALHAWFDKWLQERDVDTGPPVEVFLNNGKIYTAPVWPPTPDKKIRFYPAADGSLGSSSGAAGTVQYIAGPQDTGNYAATFDSKPFKEDTLIVGLPKLHLVETQTSPFLHINATLYDVDGDTADAIGKANWAIQPELREGIGNPQPAVPGLPMSMDLTSMAQAHVLEKGHVLRFVVSSYNSDKVPTFGAGGAVLVHVGGDDPTYFDLPIVENPRYYDEVCYGADPPLRSVTCISP